MNIKKEDALEKVMGKAIYPDDIEFEGMLYAGVFRSSIAYGKVKNIDMKAAKMLKGVAAVIDHTMIPGEKLHGVVFKDQPVLVHNMIKRAGDPIVLIVAESKDILKKALSLIKVEYEEYKGIFSIEEALADDAPILGENGNILYDLKIKKGSMEEGFKKAVYTVENWYSTPHIDHAVLQPEAAVARYDEDGNVEVNVATQYPHYDREEVARSLGIPEDNVIIKNTAIGGAFGCREDITLQCHAALAVYHTKKPVKIVYSREESMVTHCKRHAIKMHYITGVDAQGKLCALKATIYGDTGAYCSWGMNVLRKAAVHAVGPYEVPNVDIQALAVYTNNSFCGAMRGFGAAQAALAYESQMDELARLMQIHPLQFRYMNAVEDGSVMPTGQILETSVGMKKCIEEIANLEEIVLK
ncbi:xanthine dehydrogenase family protein molybdopterin-binding subunit [Clostridium swellfunianum]|uniref:xanthine dehydrogenase family protein molybdopterin-binding subunit n=1 Tax=Clostridium swellfunianum TaxID=1367462 RepID=UPI00202DD0F1|nr:molybdopterin cofactor-binding domain-containing protein [Clostridium swellfunianum]